MPRRVKSKHKAIERLVELLPHVDVGKHGRTYRITVEGSDMTTEKTKTAALAWLADLAMFYGGVDPEDVGWRGKVPSRGLSAWEQAALEWLAR